MHFVRLVKIKKNVNTQIGLLRKTFDGCVAVRPSP